MIGSPGENNNAGRVSLIYGESASGQPGPITGLVNLGAHPDRHRVGETMERRPTPWPGTR